MADLKSMVLDFVKAQANPVPISDIAKGIGCDPTSTQKAVLDLHKEGVLFRSVSKGKALFSVDSDKGEGLTPVQSGNAHIARTLNAKLGGGPAPVEDAFPDDDADAEHRPFDIKLTFKQGKRIQFKDYSIGIPDGFEYKTDVNGRDFVIWMPPTMDLNDLDPDGIPVMSPFVLMEVAQNDESPREAIQMVQIKKAYAYTLASGILQQNLMGTVPVVLDTQNIAALYQKTLMTNYSVHLIFNDYMKVFTCRIDPTMEPSSDKETVFFESALASWIDTVELRDPYPVRKPMDSPDFFRNGVTKDAVSEWGKYAAEWSNQSTFLCTQAIQYEVYRYNATHPVWSFTACKAKLLQHLEAERDDYNKMVMETLNCVERYKGLCNFDIFSPLCRQALEIAAIDECSRTLGDDEIKLKTDALRIRKRIEEISDISRRKQQPGKPSARPTVKDPETGEIREISMDEFMEAVHKTDGFLWAQQVVTDRHGARNVTDIYGNLSGVSDGLDRSVNVFCRMSDLGPFISRLIDKTDDIEQDENPDTNGFVMTIDLVDKAFTVVMTKTETKCKVELFQRDDRKSNSPNNLMDSDEWAVVDGSLQCEISREAFQEGKLLYFLLSCIGLRKYIKKDGSFAKLKAIENKGAGIIVSADDTSISIRIVQGKDRPNLPCNVPLLGERMMRPYPDEMIMDAMSGGNTIVPDGSEHKPDVKQKTSQKKQLDKQALRQSVGTVRDKLHDESEKRIGKTERESANKVEQARQRLVQVTQTEADRCGRELEATRAEVNALSESLQSMGLFQFKQKSEVKTKLEQLKQRISQLEQAIRNPDSGDIKKAKSDLEYAEKELSDIAVTRTKWEDAVEEACTEYERRVNLYVDYAEGKKMVLASSLGITDWMEWEWMQAVYSVAFFATIRDMQQQSYELSKIDHMKVASLVRRMVDKGYLTKTMSGGQYHFDADKPLPRQVVDDTGWDIKKPPVAPNLDGILSGHNTKKQKKA